MPLTQTDHRPPSRRAPSGRRSGPRSEDARHRWERRAHERPATATDYGALLRFTAVWLLIAVGLAVLVLAVVLLSSSL